MSELIFKVRVNSLDVHNITKQCAFVHVGPKKITMDVAATTNTT